MVRRSAPWLVLARIGTVPSWVAIAVIFVAMDGCNWLAHLANHRIRMLWRFHELHHSQEDMSVLTVFRTHPLIHVSYLIALVPGIVLVANGALPTTLLVVYGGVVAFAHSNTNLGFGPLGRIFVSPNYHRIHHQLDGPQDVNLGFALTIWDQMFHRAVFPTPETIRTDTGLRRPAADRRTVLRASAPPPGVRRSARCTVPACQAGDRQYVRACPGLMRQTGSGRWLGQDRRQPALRVAGAGLLIATGAVHLDLYLTGYRTIPTIGWLFLLQLITAFGLGAAVLVSRRRLVSAAGAVFALATLGGYLLSLRVGLFGFREVRTTAGMAAGIIEVVTFAVLATFVLGPGPGRAPAGTGGNRRRLASRWPAAVPGARWGAFCFSVLAAVLLGVLFGTAEVTSTSTGSAKVLVKLTHIHGVPVLTDAQGYTLYWFAPDTPSRSTCYGTCASYWPPVTGSPVAGPGVTGRLGTIARTGGVAQVTYNHHPLYTYVGDSAPGQANGNKINLNGGLWYEMTAAG